MKVAIVTGASRGIGRACAIKLAQVGYTVVINYASNDAKAQEVLDLIKANGGDGMLYKANVSNYDINTGTAFVLGGIVYPFQRGSSISSFSSRQLSWLNGGFIIE